MNPPHDDLIPASFADPVDLRLIRFLQDNPRASYATIARMTGMSQTTVRRRVDALMESGVIVASISPAVLMLGYHGVALIGLKLDLNHRREVAAAIQQMPEVTSANATLGRFDLVLQVAKRTPSDLSQFVSERIAPLPGVRDIDVMVVTDSVKLYRHWRVPLEEAGDGVVDARTADSMEPSAMRAARRPKRARQPSD